MRILVIWFALIVDVAIAHASPIEKFQCALIVSSKPSLREAVLVAQDLPRTSEIFLASNGWYAISKKRINRGTSKNLLATLIRTGDVPSDAYCSTGRQYTASFDQRGRERWTKSASNAHNDKPQTLTGNYVDPLTLKPGYCLVTVASRRSESEAVEFILNELRPSLANGGAYGETIIKYKNGWHGIGAGIIKIEDFESWKAKMVPSIPADTMCVDSFSRAETLIHNRRFNPRSGEQLAGAVEGFQAGLGLLGAVVGAIAEAGCPSGNCSAPPQNAVCVEVHNQCFNNCQSLTWQDGGFIEASSRTKCENRCSDNRFDCEYRNQ